MRLSKLLGRFAAATKQRDGRSCLQVINEEIAVTNKEGNPEESFVQDLPDSRGTELYRAVRLLRVRPTVTERAILLDLQGEERCRKVQTVPKDCLTVHRRAPGPR
jgi:hypothetical protein